MTCTVIPCRAYRDPRAAMRWLTDALGFEEQLVSEGEGGRIDHAQMVFRGGVVMIGTSETPEPPVLVYLVTDDVDAAYARAQAAGADVTRALQDTDYGSREFSVRDPEGGHWAVGTYDPSAAGGAG